jgi:hypothetical protein
LVARIGDTCVALHRIDRRTESMAASLPGDVVGTIQEAFRANGPVAPADGGPHGRTAP